MESSPPSSRRSAAEIKLADSLLVSTDQQPGAGTVGSKTAVRLGVSSLDHDHRDIAFNILFFRHLVRLGRLSAYSCAAELSCIAPLHHNAGV